jgi:hypothetical protein
MIDTFESVETFSMNSQVPNPKRNLFAKRATTNNTGNVNFMKLSLRMEKSLTFKDRIKKFRPVLSGVQEQVQKIRGVIDTDTKL